MNAIHYCPEYNLISLSLNLCVFIIPLSFLLRPNKARFYVVHCLLLNVFSDFQDGLELQDVKENEENELVYL